MTKFYKQLGAVFCLLSLFLTCTPKSEAASAEAADIMDAAAITGYEGFTALGYLYDKNEAWGMTMESGCSLTLEAEGGIGSVYIVFHKNYESYIIRDNASGAVYIRENPFLHDFVDLQEAFGVVPASVTLTFDAGDVAMNEIYAFSPGQVPDFVQQWRTPGEGDTDLVLFSTHGDDEHLFFAGLLPYYAGELGYQVQVVYLTDHHNNVGTTRCREMLDGLWAVGVDTYPVFGEYPDFFQSDIGSAYYQFQWEGYPREHLVGFVVEQLRRFRPKVAVGHDFAGEYGHGQHMVYADVLAEAVEISMDAAQYPESAERYGVWNVPKTYFHLYEENPVAMDWDRPLDAFDGMTAFQVSIQLGFAKHKSQIADFEWYYRGCDLASEVPRFNPCRFGLYRSTVGEDRAKDDLFEHVTTHAEDARQEAMAQLEQQQVTLPPETEPPESLPTEPPAVQNTPESGSVLWLLAVGLLSLLWWVRRRKTT